MLRHVSFALAALAALPLASARAADKKPAPPTVAVFQLKGALSEGTAAESFPFGDAGGTSLRELVARLDKAATDPAVKAVVVMAEGSAAGTAQKEELRQAMARVRAANKPIFAHSDSVGGMGEYALLCGVTRLSVVPTGDIGVVGMGGEALFLRGLFDKLGVQPDFLTCGAYKSAAEQYMRTSPSPEAERMQNWLFDSLFDTYVGMIAKGRNVDAAKVKGWIDAGPYSAEKALAAGMIDAVEHRQAFEAHVKEKVGGDATFDKKYGEKKAPTMDFSSPFAIFKIFGDMANESKTKKDRKPAVAIVYVEGAISTGSGSASPFGMGGGAYSSDIRKALDEAAADDSIKAVVLRVNSPGGSAVASEIILDATKRVKAKKPFVVSMGDVAGSGGYYVACASDVIFADEGTITGSIGVVSGKLVTNGMWNKVGVTFHPYRRGANAGMLMSDRPFTPEERAKMQSYMDEIYGVFKGHVTAIRGGRLTKPIDELAGGRVYTGKQALELGLIDKIGTQTDAVKFVAAKANLNEYEVRQVPEPKNILEQLMDSAGSKDDGKTLKLSLWELALPQLQAMDPERVALVKTALRQLETLRAEGVSLTMPVYLVR